MKALKAIIKLSEAPQRVKMKIYVIFYFNTIFLNDLGGNG